MLSAGRDRLSGGRSMDGTLQPGTMRPNLGPAIEDSIKVIDALSHVDGRGITNRSAERPTVTPASVTGKVKKLAATRTPLVLCSKRRGAALSAGGERVALEIIHHHRLLELHSGPGPATVGPRCTAKPTG
jgi:hypothetical protein